jgi:hypothetical protein
MVSLQGGAPHSQSSFPARVESKETKPQGPSTSIAASMREAVTCSHFMNPSPMAQIETAEWRTALRDRHQ